MRLDLHAGGTGSTAARALGNLFGVVRSGQTHVQRYMRPLLERIQKGEIDPTFIITHRMRLEDAPQMYRTFRDKQDDCLKVVLKTQYAKAA